MNCHRNPAAAVILVACIFFSLATLTHFTTGCSATQAQKDGAAIAYGGELVACVQDAGSRAQADTCREGVDKKYGVDAGIGGAK